MSALLLEEALAKELADLIRQATAPLRIRIEQLERTVKQLEARPSDVRACGTWVAREYSGGNLVVHNGSMWCAQERTQSKPAPTRHGSSTSSKGRSHGDAGRKLPRAHSDFGGSAHQHRR